MLQIQYRHRQIRNHFPNPVLTSQKRNDRSAAAETTAFKMKSLLLEKIETDMQSNLCNQHRIECN